MNSIILIVDDAPAIVESLKMALPILGVQQENIFSAATAKQAMRLFNEVDPEVVFMDIQLPDASGDQVAIHMLAANPHVKIVVLTGLDRADQRVRDIVSAGAYEVIEKPVRLDRLRDLLATVEREKKGLGRVM